MSARRDGAQLSAIPWVPCAQATTGRPPAGALPVGATINPETAMSLPSTAREWYSTFQALAPGTAVNGTLQMRSPGFAVGNGSGGV